MVLARTDTIDQRLAILERLTLRNRVVATLRVTVPVVGLAALAALALQIIVSNMLNQYGVAGIRIDRGKLVVETPQYSGTGADGSRYMLSADEARTPLDNSNVIEMIGAKLVYGRPGRAAIHAHAEVANFDSAAQHVTVTGVTTLSGDDGMHGTATGLDSDLTTQITLANGPIDITFADGTHLTGANMRRDGNAQTWSFDQATLTVPQLPRGPRPIPGFARHGWVTG